MKKFPSLFSLVLILFAIWYTFYSSMPQRISQQDAPETSFSTMRALEHVKQVAKKPHYTGSKEQEDTRDYIISQLKALDLSPTIQKGFTIYKQGECSDVQNIIAKIPGSEPGKAVLLLTHYDSDPHSSIGASDAASGVATILEGVRAFLSHNKTPKNDIIICFSDGEEIGLLGADLFVKKHPWAKDIGIALNFEARGSGGNSFMLMETNGKNKNMIEAFSKANPSYPVTNSLAYSIYKMLPNDTDLTALREQGNIDGFNFAFIDDHYDYHTLNDTWQNLDKNSLQHQGSYLMPLLTYFSEADLHNLKSDKDYIYFNAPLVNMVTYPFDWIYTLLIIATILFIAVIIYGRVSYKISIKDTFKGGIALLISLLLAGGITFGGWSLLQIIYPHYSEIQHGFTYNGHQYIAAFVFLSIGICFKVYAHFTSHQTPTSFAIAPIAVWILICLLSSLYLKGASYFTVLIFFSILSILVLIRQTKPNAVLMVLLSVPAIYIITPFIATFPVALGLKILFVSAILTVLLFGLLLPILGFYKRKKSLGNIAFLLALVFLISAHFKSDFTETRQKPNSLVYILDTDENKAVWASYDAILDSWTKNYIKPGENIAETYNKNTIQNKYERGFAFASIAPSKKIPAPSLEIIKDTITGSSRILSLSIIPNRNVNRIDLYTKKLFNFESLEVNNETAIDFTYKDNNTYNAFTKRWSKNLLTYHTNGRKPLHVQMKFHKDSIPTLIVYESSYDLLNNPLFSIPSRNKKMMPKPFILNDAIVTKKSIRLAYIEKIKDTIQTDSINLQKTPVVPSITTSKESM
ncbi:M28 family peptidase [Aquimarina hainanensis]|uniref:Vacuolar membrane protease n=1 Tax=Aquimarina hainanensis TaxID=1578017 RepID=A0ABW5N661_9FLAO|nr:M28 family peptidase [Aquimarina sp. TRL1]